jgi:nucleoside-diphosphate-sugar epimerase
MGYFMRILVSGADGYLGWPTALHLSETGHAVGVLDNNVVRTSLPQLGLRPHLLSDTLVETSSAIGAGHRDRVGPRALRPSVRRRRTANPTTAVSAVPAAR